MSKAAVSYHASMLGKGSAESTSPAERSKRAKAAGNATTIAATCPYCGSHCQSYLQRRAHAKICLRWPDNVPRAEWYKSPKRKRVQWFKDGSERPIIPADEAEDTPETEPTPD
jgi:hypothetical protein